SDLSQAENFCPARFFAYSGPETSKNLISGEKKAMNALIQRQATTQLFFITLVIAYIQLSPWARAVNPPPGGGYPGQNTAEGQNPFRLFWGRTDTPSLGWVCACFQRPRILKHGGGRGHVSTKPCKKKPRHGRRRVFKKCHRIQQHRQWSIRSFQQHYW